MTTGSHRLVELDALRGIAALSVMLFHFTTRYDQLYGHVTSLLFSAPYGYFGVNLFFMISGFVIFVTLHRIQKPLDFIVSRFTRLFPAYWLAVLITFSLTQAFSLPFKTVSIDTAAMNLFMLHGLLKIPHVDGVYWTLEIELIFYCMAFLLYISGRLERSHQFLLILLALRLLYFLSSEIAGVELSWTVSHLLILPYIAWFALGIMIYRRIALPCQSPRMDWLVLMAAIVVLGIVDGAGVALLAISFTTLLWAAANGRLAILRNRVLSWLGAISYTLYLLHENIGWGVIRLAEQKGFAPNISIAVAICLVLLMATALSYSVERPVMKWLRACYNKNAISPISNRNLLFYFLAILCIFLGLGYAWRKANPPRVSQYLVSDIFSPSPKDGNPCMFTNPRSLMLLVLGQSNAGNHGELPSLSANSLSAGPTTFFYRGQCFKTSGLAPGATGEGSNIWTTLGPKLEVMSGRPVVFSVLAVSSTRIQDWITPGVLRAQLIETIEEQRRHGFTPDAILWQQGEADARAGTSTSEYMRDFQQLAALLRTHGITAPILAALSTRCRNAGSNSVRTAIEQLAHNDSSIKIGPDTDLLTETHFRHDGCHFSESGIEESANAWTSIIKTLLSTTAPIL